MNPGVFRPFAILSWLAALLTPIVLVLAAVRLLISPLFLVIEYNTPAFPHDPYGFTQEERLYWAKIAVAYLVNDADITYLGDLHFPAGQSAPEISCAQGIYGDDCTRLYNDREQKHMLDVKIVVQAAMQVGMIALVGLAFLAFLAWRGGWEADFRRGLANGGWLTVMLLTAVILFVLIAFGVIFVAFHQVFFASGTWIFLNSDTLIRLFPERFWRDTFIAVGALAGGAGLALALGLQERGKR